MTSKGANEIMVSWTVKRLEYCTWPLRTISFPRNCVNLHLTTVSPTRSMDSMIGPETREKIRLSRRCDGTRTTSLPKHQRNANKSFFALMCASTPETILRSRSSSATCAILPYTIPETPRNNPEPVSPMRPGRLQTLCGTLKSGMRLLQTPDWTADRNNLFIDPTFPPPPNTSPATRLLPVPPTFDQAYSMVTSVFMLPLSNGKHSSNTLFPFGTDHAGRSRFGSRFHPCMSISGSALPRYTTTRIAGLQGDVDVHASCCTSCWSA